MPELSARIAGLSDDKQRLLQRLLTLKETSIAIDAARAPAAPTREPVRRTPAAEASASAGEVKDNYRRFYDAINGQLDASVFGPFSFFLNYGYVPDLSPQWSKVQLADHVLNKNSVRLMLEVIGDCDLQDRRILDVGCGRGGMVFVIKQFFAARSIQGVDLSPSAISFCRAQHRHDNVRFDEGDAERLPFEDGQFDVVTNVESSHSYPNLAAFYADVFRVLVPGGCFLYTDVMPMEAIPEYRAWLERLGFTMEVERDITANVLLSCNEVSRARVGAFDASNDPNLMHNFLAAPGSQVYDDMQSRRWSYRIYRFRKPAASNRPAQ
jgi:phthiocerol/phenolphthiocerol synthesis type-I polyketide synthase E